MLTHWFEFLEEILRLFIFPLLDQRDGAHTVLDYQHWLVSLAMIILHGKTPVGFRIQRKDLNWKNYNNDSTFKRGMTPYLLTINIY